LKCVETKKKYPMERTSSGVEGSREDNKTALVSVVKKKN